MKDNIEKLLKGQGKTRKILWHQIHRIQVYKSIRIVWSKEGIIFLIFHGLDEKRESLDAKHANAFALAKRHVGMRHLRLP